MQKVNQRREKILLALKKCDYLTVNQVQRLLHLTSKSNAYRVINQMHDYINHFYLGQKIYYLNQKGREIIGATKVRHKTTNIDHYIMRNDLYLKCGMPASWKNEVRMKYESDNNKITIVCDAIFTTPGKHYIIEIDNLQSMPNNHAKISKYKQLVELKCFNRPITLIWVTTSSYRLNKLKELCHGIDCEFYLKEDIK